MKFGGPFHALSLDLWFTTIYHGPEAMERTRANRLRALSKILRAADGHSLTAMEIETAVEAVHSRLDAQGKGPLTVNPEALVRAYAERLGAEVVLSAGTVGRGYVAEDSDENAPTANPEAVELIRVLTVRKFPVVAITNTTRDEAFWQGFLRTRLGVSFRHIITSCEVGRAKPDPEIFREAARRLDLPPHELLHVGDRWELDVEGAQRAGCGAVLYRGLWPSYPKGMYPETDPRLFADSDVLCIDRLAELLSGGLLDAGTGERPTRPPERPRSGARATGAGTARTHRTGDSSQGSMHD